MMMKGYNLQCSLAAIARRQQKSNCSVWFLPRRVTKRVEKQKPNIIKWRRRVNVLNVVDCGGLTVWLRRHPCPNAARTDCTTTANIPEVARRRCVPSIV